MPRVFCPMSIKWWGQRISPLHLLRYRTWKNKKAGWWRLRAIALREIGVEEGSEVALHQAIHALEVRATTKREDIKIESDIALAVVAIVREAEEAVAAVEVIEGEVTARVIEEIGVDNTIRGMIAGKDVEIKMIERGIDLVQVESKAW